MWFKKYGGDGFNAVFMSIISRSFRQVRNSIRFRAPNCSLIFAHRICACALDVEYRPTNMRPAWHLSCVVSIDDRYLFMYNFHFFSTLWHPRCYLISANVIFLEILARPAKSRWDAKIRCGCWRYEKMTSDCSARVLTSIPPHTWVAFSERCVFTGKSKTIIHPLWVAKVRCSNGSRGGKERKSISTRFLVRY